RSAGGGTRQHALPNLIRGVLSDQHGDGRAAVRPGHRVRRAAGFRTRLRPLLRDRDDCAAHGSARGSGLGARAGRGSGGRRDRDRLEEELGSMRFRISSEAFFQTNTEMAEQLYGLAIEYAGLRGSERVYDLYCGIGTIALLMAPRAAQVWGLELAEEAVGDAIEIGWRRNSAACASESHPRRSFRPTRRWPSSCTAWPSSTQGCGVPNASTTSTAGSGRLRCSWLRARLRSGGSSWPRKRWATRS